MARARARVGQRLLADAGVPTQLASIRLGAVHPGVWSTGCHYVEGTDQVNLLTITRALPVFCCTEDEMRTHTSRPDKPHATPLSKIFSRDARRKAMVRQLNQGTEHLPNHRVRANSWGDGAQLLLRATRTREVRPDGLADGNVSNMLFPYLSILRTFF
jgi:hypothetical protein